MPHLADETGHISGLVADYAKKFRLRTGVECILVLPEEELALDANQSVTLFRILQESLGNVAKYAQASKVKYYLRNVRIPFRWQLKTTVSGSTLPYTRNDPSA